MEINEEIASKLTNALGVLKKKYDTLKHRRDKLKNLISATKENIKELNQEFQTLSSVYPLETEKSIRQNLILKYKLKKIKEVKQQDLNQLVSLQDITEKSISQLAIERNKLRKIREKKNNALEDLQQITEIVQYLKTTPSNEQIALQQEEKLKVVLRKSESEKQQLISSLYSLKQEFDKIDDTIRSLQLKLSSKIRDVSECEEKIAFKDDTINDLKFQIDELYDKSEYLNQQYDEKVLESDEIQSNVKDLSTSLHQINEERASIALRLQAKQKKYSNLKIELKKYCNLVENRLNSESLKLETEMNSRVQAIQQIISTKDDEIRKLEEQIRKVKQETAEITSQQENIQKEIDEEREKLEKYNTESLNRLRSMQAVINSLASNIIG
ncbi:hypothetical protein M9Y10_000911 [Tritrichomonas musculus]|uniref:Uncharacterized protein n=1 Tax=Tritrichomonas musculus TaxID=1915356 RepID=A0ABR2L5J5_9EUKA